MSWLESHSTDRFMKMSVNFQSAHEKLNSFNEGGKFDLPFNGYYGNILQWAESIWWWDLLFFAFMCYI